MPDSGSRSQDASAGSSIACRVGFALHDQGPVKGVSRTGKRMDTKRYARLPAEIDLPIEALPRWDGAACVVVVHLPSAGAVAGRVGDGAGGVVLTLAPRVAREEERRAGRSSFTRTEHPVAALAAARDAIFLRYFVTVRRATDIPVARSSSTNASSLNGLLLSSLSINSCNFQPDRVPRDVRRRRRLRAPTKNRRSGRMPRGV